MREEDSNWFSKWEDELPPPDELISLSQTLITPDLASAFDIRSSGVNNNIIISNNNNNNNSNNNNNNDVPMSFLHHHQQYTQKQHHQSNSAPQQPPPQPNSSEFDSSSAELCGGGGGGGATSGGGGGGGPEEPARTLKRPRLVWTPQLHKRFVDAVAHLGIKNAVPKTIMQLMSVDGLTRENVASHLQKYRLYLKRMQGLNNAGGPGVGPAPGGSGDAATDHLFASSPVPAHFLHQNGPASAGGGGGGSVRPNSDHFMPYMPVAALNHHQMAAAVVGHQQIQAQYQQQHRQMGHFGSAQSVGGGGGGGGGQFEHPFLSRQAQLGPSRNGLIQSNSGFVEDVESATANNGGRKVLTLFPDGDD